MLRRVSPGGTDPPMDEKTVDCVVPAGGQSETRPAGSSRRGRSSTSSVPHRSTSRTGRSTSRIRRWAAIDVVVHPGGTRRRPPPRRITPRTTRPGSPSRGWPTPPGVEQEAVPPRGWCTRRPGMAETASMAPSPARNTIGTWVRRGAADARVERGQVGARHVGTIDVLHVGSRGERCTAASSPSRRTSCSVAR